MSIVKYFDDLNVKELLKNDATFKDFIWLSILYSHIFIDISQLKYYRALPYTDRYKLDHS